MAGFLTSFPSPVIVAPMSGGPTTPELVMAADAAGSFSALALGTCSVADAEDQIAAMVGHAYGVNLFHPQPPLAPAQYRAAQALAKAEGTQLSDADLTFGWHHKLEAALAAQQPPAVVWAMFGLFTAEELGHVHDAGSEAWVTVTTEADARAAARAGVDVICVQGPEAGGHRGTWSVGEEPDARPLRELVAAVYEELRQEGCEEIPLVAAGGLRTADDVAEALTWPGVIKVSCGSAFLLADEAGTSEANRELIVRAGAVGSEAAGSGMTVSTRAFSGRYARGLETDYTRAHPGMEPVYPYLNPILAGRRAAGDPSVAYCLVGTRPEEIGGGSVAQILSGLDLTGQ